ncbi:MAG: PA domain-containing protein [Pseudomonadota bacterium]
MSANKRPALRHAAAALMLLGCAWSADAQAASITVINSNEANIGFNDPTPVEPVGGNAGRTLGEQRLIAFQHAADLWGSTINSNVQIRIEASFEPLPCDANGAVLGSAGAAEIFTDFTKAPKKAWYPSALASKLAGIDMATPGQPHIRARFNSRIGLFPDCLPGAPFYLGVDNKHGDQVDLVAVLLHEIAHGLGFQSFTDDETGAQYENLPSVWDFFLIDSRTERLWADMTADERRLSAISGPYLAWNGALVKGELPHVLKAQSNLAISGKSSGKAKGDYEVGDASFGPELGTRAVKGQLMPVVDQADGSGLACAPLDAKNARAVRGNVALVDRGTCSFTIKARMVQDAGAKAMVLAENAPGPVTPLGGADTGITIPSVRISFEAGKALKAVLAKRSGSRSGVSASLGVDPKRRAGTDLGKRIRMHSPIENEPGSSVSHFTVDARGNQLMEPAINQDLQHAVKPVTDLTYTLLQDIGW